MLIPFSFTLDFVRMKLNSIDHLMRKKKKANPTLSPGILTVYCPRGVSYGFSMLSDVESLNSGLGISQTGSRCFRLGLSRSQTGSK